jgi:hypothetical protein
LGDGKVGDTIGFEKADLFVCAGIFFDDNKRELLGALDNVDSET